MHTAHDSFGNHVTHWPEWSDDERVNVIVVLVYAICGGFIQS